MALLFCLYVASKSSASLSSCGQVPKLGGQTAGHSLVIFMFSQAVLSATKALTNNLLSHLTSFVMSIVGGSDHQYRDKVFTTSGPSNSIIQRNGPFV